MKQAIQLLVLTALGLTAHLRAETQIIVAESTPLGNGLYYSDWFQVFFTNDPLWLYQQDLGWMYSAPATTTAQMWFYQQPFGWLFTGNGTYPTFFVSTTQNWYYLNDDNGTRYVYNAEGNYTTNIGVLNAPIEVEAATTFRGRFHNVSGSVGLYSDNTIRVTGFNYDGGGIDTRFILSDNASYSNYVILSGNLVNSTGYTNTFATLLLPPQFQNSPRLYLSVWCVPVSQSFGDAQLNR